MDVTLNRTLPLLTSFVGNFAASGVVTLQIPNSGTYFGIDLYLTTAGVAMTQANIEAMVKEIRLKLNGRVQRTIDPHFLIEINNFHGRPFTAGWLSIFFSEPWRTTDQGEDSLAWGMAEISTFQMEVEFTAAAVTPAIVAHTSWSPRQTTIGLINKWRKFDMPITAIGGYQWQGIKDESWYAFHAKTNTLASVTLKVDQNIVIQADKAYLDVYYKNRGLIPQADMTHVDLTMLTGRASDLLAFTQQDATGKTVSAVSDLRVDFVTTTSATFPVLLESVGRPF